MALSTQEANLFETTVEHGVLSSGGRFFMFGGALYDSGTLYDGEGYGGPSDGPCLVTTDITHCIGVIFNAMYQQVGFNVVRFSSLTGYGDNLFTVGGNTYGGSDTGTTAGGANAQAATFESCVFNLMWTTASTAYIIQSPTYMSPLNYLRVLRQCQFSCGGTGSGSFTGSAYVLQYNGQAVVENCVYFMGSSKGIFPPISNPSYPSPLSSNTTYQNINGQAIEIYLPVSYNPNILAAATMQPRLGPSSPPASFPGTETQPAGSSAGVIRIFRLRVPAGWFYEFDTSNATLGTPFVIEL
jgi:hypothetical protein